MNIINNAINNANNPTTKNFYANKYVKAPAVASTASQPIPLNQLKTLQQSKLDFKNKLISQQKEIISILENDDGSLTEKDKEQLHLEYQKLQETFESWLQKESKLLTVIKNNAPTPKPNLPQANNNISNDTNSEDSSNNNNGNIEGSNEKLSNNLQDQTKSENETLQPDQIENSSTSSTPSTVSSTPPSSTSDNSTTSTAANDEQNNNLNNNYHYNIQEDTENYWNGFGGRGRGRGRGIARGGWPIVRGMRGNIRGIRGGRGKRKRINEPLFKT